MHRNKEIIDDSDKLLRRVQFLDPNFIKPNGTPASSSFSLKKGEDGLSVDIERLTNYQHAINDRKRFRLFSLQASFVRSLELNVIHDPQTDNFAHALIMGNISRGKARMMAMSAVKISYPD